MWATHTGHGSGHMRQEETGTWCGSDGKMFEEGHDRTIRLGISQEKTGSSPAHLCLTWLLRRLGMQNNHVVHLNVGPSLALTG